jgi:hypothetical protein
MPMPPNLAGIAGQSRLVHQYFSGNDIHSKPPAASRQRQAASGAHRKEVNCETLHYYL